MAKATLSFAVYRNGALLRRETLAQDIVKVGNDPKSHLRVDDAQAARMHAVIEVDSPSASRSRPTAPAWARAATSESA